MAFVGAERAGGAERVVRASRNRAAACCALPRAPAPAPRAGFGCAAPAPGVRVKTGRIVMARMKSAFARVLAALPCSCATRAVANPARVLAGGANLIVDALVLVLVLVALTLAAAALSGTAAGTPPVSGRGLATRRRGCGGSCDDFARARDAFVPAARAGWCPGLVPRTRCVWTSNSPRSSFWLKRLLPVHWLCAATVNAGSGATSAMLMFDPFAKPARQLPRPPRVCVKH